MQNTSPNQKNGMQLYPVIYPSSIEFQGQQQLNQYQQQQIFQIQNSMIQNQNNYMYSQQLPVNTTHSLNNSVYQDINKKYVDIQPELNNSNAYLQTKNINNESTDHSIERIQDRKCTNIGCIIVFLVTFLTLFIVAISVAASSDDEIFRGGFDSDNQPCGKTSLTQNYPYLYFLYNNDTTNNSTRLCVKNCPNNNKKQVDYLPNSKITKLDDNTYNTIVDPKYICIKPEKSDEKSFENKIITPFSENIVIIIITIIISILINMFFLIQLKNNTQCMFHTIFAITAIAALIFGILLIAHQMVVFGVIVLLVCAVMIFVMYSKKDQIKFLIGIVKAAAYFLNQQSVILWLPIVVACVASLFIVFIIGTIKNLYGCGGERVQRKPNSPYGDIQINSSQEIGVTFLVFCLIWGCNFLSHVLQFSIAYATCNWYFSDGKHKNPIKHGIKHTFRYHLGSIAFGSLIVAVIQATKKLLEYLTKNMCGGFLKCLLQAILGCFERLIELINFHAYIQIALKGQPFCNSAKAAWQLIQKYMDKFGISIGMFSFLSIGSIIVLTILITAIGFLLILVTSLNDDDSNLGLSIAIVFVIALAISTLCVSVWKIIAETLVHNFCVDLDLSGTTATFAPQILKDALKK